MIVTLCNGSLKGWLIETSRGCMMIIHIDANLCAGPSRGGLLRPPAMLVKNSGDDYVLGPSRGGAIVLLPVYCVGRIDYFAFAAASSL